MTRLGTGRTATHVQHITYSRPRRREFGPIKVDKSVPARLDHDLAPDARLAHSPALEHKQPAA